MQVRPAESSDVGQYRAIRLEALSDAPYAFNSTLGEAERYPLTHWLDLITRRDVYLAFEGDVVVGTATYAPYAVAATVGAGLFGMYVTPSRRGTGVAERLVDAVVASAKRDGYPSLWLDVTKGNDRAAAFYRRLGFGPRGPEECATLVGEDRMDHLSLVFGARS